MTRTPSPNLAMLADRLVSKLQRLYGSQAEVALPAVIAECAYHLARWPAEMPRRWDERDTVLIAYADHVRDPVEAPLAALRRFLADADLADAFSTVHLLPFFPSSSDDGFSVIDYRAVSPDLGSWSDIDDLAREFDLVVDLVLNHVSRSSDWFRAYLAGHEPGIRFFLEADPADDHSAVVRPRTSPLLTQVETSRGTRHVWTTFSDDQIDLNYSEPLLLAEIIGVLLLYIRHGARIVRLDAVAFLWKERGTSCIHHPLTHVVVKILRDIVDAIAPSTWILTETNVPHEENVSYLGRGDEAQLIYNFALPPLLLDALLTGDGGPLSRWLASSREPPAGATLLNFTASHDGIGIRPLESLVPPDRVERLVAAVEARGGRVSKRAGPSGEALAYELNITYFDALSDPEDPSGERQSRRFLLSQALALSLRGIPAVYFASLFATPNDTIGMQASGRPRSINRHRFTRAELDTLLTSGGTPQRVFDEYRRLLSIRRGHRAFHPDAPQNVMGLGSAALVGFLRTSVDGADTVLVAANVSTDSHTIDLARLGLRTEGPELCSGRTAHGEQPLELAPYEFVWLPVKAHPSAEPLLMEGS